MTLRHFLAAGVLAIGLDPTLADAQLYPARPIKVIVPYTPGSPVDVLARVVMQHTATQLGQPVVLDNRPGAGTTIGTKAAAIADPDGYTLLIAATSFIISASLYPLAPAGTPADIVSKLNTKIHEAMRSPELTASMAKLGFEPKIRSPVQYAAFLADEMRRWPPIVKASGVRPG